MRFGITGAHGFVGSNLYNNLKIEHDCELFDRQKYDIFNSDSMRHFVEDKDLIFHLAGLNRASGGDLIKTNVIGTMNLLESIRKFSNNKTKVIFSSSMQVYGLTQKPVYFSESDVLKPDNIYGLSKKMAEDVLKFYYETSGINSIIFRISNVYGKGCRPFYNSGLATFIHLIKNGEKIKITGNGEQSRDFIHISDVVEAFMTTINYNFDKNDTFNICTGEAISINYAVKEIEKIIKISPKIEYINTSDKINYLIGNPSKASKILGFKAKQNIIEGLNKTILD